MTEKTPSNAVSFAHSPLVSTSGSHPAADDPVRSKHLQDVRKKVNEILYAEVLDFKHQHPSVIEASLDTMIKIFKNVLENPAEDKFRKVRHICCCLAAESPYRSFACLHLFII